MAASNLPVIIPIILIGPILLLDILAILEISKAPYKEKYNKWTWMNIIFFLPLAGLILYHIYGRKQLQEAEAGD